MTPETIQETMRLWREEPDKAKGRPVVKARSDGSQAVLEAGPFTWRADLPPPLGGTNEAPSPMPMLLGALAGCAKAYLGLRGARKAARGCGDASCWWRDPVPSRMRPAHER